MKRIRWTNRATHARKAVSGNGRELAWCGQRGKVDLHDDHTAVTCLKYRRTLDKRTRMIVLGGKQ